MIQIKIIFVFILCTCLTFYNVKSQNVRNCAPNESQCNPSTAPYTCLEGTSIGGCHPNPSFWPTIGCTNQCRNSDNPTPTPGEVRDCLPNESQCSSTFPYTCLDNPWIGECYSKPEFWPTHDCPNQCKNGKTDP